MPGVFPLTDSPCRNKFSSCIPYVLADRIETGGNILPKKKLTPSKELEMGDKGGKKDKDKNKKQMAQKHDQKVKETKDKQPKKVEK